MKICRQGGASEVYNIGASKGTIIGSFASTLQNLVDQKMIVNDMEKAFLRSSKLVAESRKLVSLEWKAQVPFDDGLRRTIYWFKYTNPVVAI